MRWLAATWSCACSCMWLGCIELPDFPDASILEGPRVLAVIAEPPEITPGDDVSLSVLVAGAEQVEVEYEICGALDSVFGGSQYGEQDEDDCSGQTALLRGSGPTWVIPGAALAPLWANRELVGTILGRALPASTLEQIRSTVGIPLLVEARVIADGQTLRAVKRVLLSENPTPHTNPPPPQLRVDDNAIEADPEASHSCLRADRAPIMVRPQASVRLVPATSAPDDTEGWVERYRVLNSRGELEERTERAFYSWFATAGSFERNITRAPLRNQVWTAPSKLGEHRLWVVIRDGHGGSSACGFDVIVQPSAMDTP
jgi:hypothetical protein